MEAIVREEFPHPTMTKSIPVEVMKVEKGKVFFNAIANNKHLNTQCGVHGEFASTVLDSVTRCDVHTLLGAGVAYGTIDLNIRLIRPVPKDENLIVEGNVNQNFWK
jgi:acyl-coenzyme A thioesterase PaaI-like protein